MKGIGVAAVSEGRIGLYGLVVVVFEEFGTVCLAIDRVKQTPTTTMNKITNDGAIILLLVKKA
jgi:hypothetical protein